MPESQLDITVTCHRPGCDWSISRTWREHDVSLEAAGDRTKARLRALNTRYAWHVLAKHVWDGS